jgi:hypothetical protein
MKVWNKAYDGGKKKQRRKERKRKEKEEITPAVVRNKDWCFQVSVVNSCCAGMHNIKSSKALNILSV